MFRAGRTNSAALLKTVLWLNGAAEHGLLEEGGGLKHVHDHTYRTHTATHKHHQQRSESNDKHCSRLGLDGSDVHHSKLLNIGFECGSQLYDI